MWFFFVKAGKSSKFWCWAANNVTTHTAFIFLTCSLYLEMLQKFKLSSRICSICICFLFRWEWCVLLEVGILVASCLVIKDEAHLVSSSIYEEMQCYILAKQVDKWSLHFQLSFPKLFNVVDFYRHFSRNGLPWWSILLQELLYLINKRWNLAHRGRFRGWWFIMP